MMSVKVIPTPNSVSDSNHVFCYNPKSYQKNFNFQNPVNTKSLSNGKHSHAHILYYGMSGNRYLANLLIQMYGDCLSFQDAYKIFVRMKNRNVYSWNIMNGVYVENGLFREALQLFQQMPLPNVVSWNTIMAAYIQYGYTEKAIQMFHVMPERDTISWNTILAAYAQNGHFEKAVQLFQDMPQRDKVSWNTMIAAYAQQGLNRESLHLFREMHLQGLIPNRVTFLVVLEACVKISAPGEGRQLHCLILTYGLEKDIVLCNALSNMYGKCGYLHDSHRIFDRMTVRDVISWNTLIIAYATHNQGKEALLVFEHMLSEKITPDAITFVGVLDACACLGALEEGRKIHNYISSTSFYTDITVATALINMYGDCGCLQDAISVFNATPRRDAILWTAMIAAYAQYGHGKEALSLSHRMQLQGMRLDKVALVNLLCAFSTAGMEGEGCHCFVSIFEITGITPIAEHYNSMMVLLGHAGNVELANTMMNNMPIEPNSVSWMCYFGVYGTNIGRRAHLLSLQPASCRFQTNRRQFSEAKN